MLREWAMKVLGSDLFARIVEETSSVRFSSKTGPVGYIYIFNLYKYIIFIYLFIDAFISVLRPWLM